MSPQLDIWVEIIIEGACGKIAVPFYKGSKHSWNYACDTFVVYSWPS